MHTQIFFKNYIILARCLSFAAILSGCSQEDIYPSQIIATVDGVEITAHQLNSEIKYNLDHNIVKNVNETIEDLINRQLLVNQSLKLNTNRKPEVIQELEDEKARIYAKVYLNELRSKVSLDDNEIIEEIKTQRPDIFLNHKTYKIETIKITNSVSLPLIDRIVFNLKTFNDVKQSLIDENLNFVVTTAEVPAEHMQDSFYRKYGNKLQTNQFLYSAIDNHPELCGIIEINDSVMTESLYTKLLFEKLTSEITSRIRTQEITRLRTISNIEYTQTVK
ncbi:hypothetical protein [Methylophilus aquaticus]|uniref:Peptidyl-prolyl cis-trans isomerase, EpsD family n=1 Tax=Methylophilus aquaticus TaxID=1971610 RepID=A0ABT9JT59_9PROT|nr:hypothetical protein [Methylophilus aquaticus]MDP8567743.1 hypothetical protein [Methylophilus aquaticus]